MTAGFTRFGVAAAAIGDLDDDGVTDVAVGEERDGNNDRGGVWILFLNADGTVKARQNINETSGGFGGVLADFDLFGNGLAGLGDIDGDGIEDVAVGASGDDESAQNAGAVWILFLDTDGTVKGHQKISTVSGGFTGVLDANDAFGAGLATLGDLDGDGVVDLAVGAVGDDDGNDNAGAVWVLFLDSDGTVKSSAKISNTAGGLGGALSATAQFGLAIARLGDLDEDGVADLAVGAPGTDSGGTPLEEDIGAVWIVFLNSDGSVKDEQEIGAITGDFVQRGFLGGVVSGTGGDELFGEAVTELGDIDGDDIPDLLVGSPGIEAGNAKLWTLLLNRDGTVKHESWPHTVDSSIHNVIGSGSTYGSALGTLGDLDGNGFVDTLVGHGRIDAADVAWVLFHDAPVPVRCASGPAMGCISAAKGSVTIAARPDNRSFLKWKLKKGDAFSQIDLGDPRNTTAYTMCVFDYVAALPAVATELIVTATDRNWVDKSPKGFVYGEDSRRMAGVRQIKLRTGDATRTSVQVHASGKYFPRPQAVALDRMLEVDLQVLIQLIHSDGFCVEAALSNVRKNTATRFKATMP